MPVWGRAGAAATTIEVGTAGRNAGRRAFVLAVTATVIAGASVSIFFAGVGSFMPFVLLGVLGLIVPLLCLVSLVFAVQAMRSGEGIGSAVAGAVLAISLMGCLGVVYWAAFSVQTGAPM